jgi:hypothetical protein
MGLLVRTFFRGRVQPASALTEQRAACVKHVSYGRVEVEFFLFFVECS